MPVSKHWCLSHICSQNKVVFFLLLLHCSELHFKELIICNLQFYFVSLCGQAQLIHDRNTASRSAPAVKASVAAAMPEKVQMTWTKEKFVAEKHKNKDTNVSGFKDIFNMKP